MKKIYTFGDGFATGHLWPEWPQILQALVPEYPVINTCSAIGAGAEYLVTGFVDLVPELANNLVIFQWPMAARFDKLIEDKHWFHVGKTDPVYHFNFHKRPYGIWWISSASQQPQVKEYHEKFVQSGQHNIRLQNYQTLVRNTLENLNCDYCFTSTNEQQYYSTLSRFAETRQQEVQPSPVVHYYFLIEKILPNINITYDQVRAHRLENLITAQSWQTHDPYREQIWRDLVARLD
jgi:hypothetical protein